jgi:hypothetical protein
MGFSKELSMRWVKWGLSIGLLECFLKSASLPSKSFCFVEDPTSTERFKKRLRVLTPQNRDLPERIQSLSIIGSAQPSLKQFETLLQDNTLHAIVDLRAETHFFVNGQPVSWGTQGKYLKTDITQDKCGLSERAWAKYHDLKYLNLKVSNYSPPTSEQINTFIRFYKALPPGTTLLIHCRGGLGRTTTFLSIVDMMQNATHDSFDAILERQSYYGGSDLREDKAGDKEKPAKERLKILKAFYAYAQRNKDDFQTPFQATLGSFKQKLLFICRRLKFLTGVSGFKPDA